MVSMERYTELITAFHKPRPNFNKVLQLILQPIIDANAFIADLPRQFDVDIAIGVQLDVVGEWVGIKRYIPTPIRDPWFRFSDYRRGWGKGIWKGKYDFGNDMNRLGDDDYRRLIYAKILANNWDGTADGMLEVFETLMPDTQITIQDDFMRDIVGISGELPDIVFCYLVEQNLLRINPGGIKTRYFFTSVSSKPLFGFGIQNNHIAGWEVGAWGNSATYIRDNQFSRIYVSRWQLFRAMVDQGMLQRVYQAVSSDPFYTKWIDFYTGQMFVPNGLFSMFAMHAMHYDTYLMGEVWRIAENYRTKKETGITRFQLFTALNAAGKLGEIYDAIPNEQQAVWADFYSGEQFAVDGLLGTFIKDTLSYDDEDMAALWTAAEAYDEDPGPTTQQILKAVRAQGKLSTIFQALPGAVASPEWIEFFAAKTAAKDGPLGTLIQTTLGYNATQMIETWKLAESIK